MPNRLANEKSLYLRQHADNPVDWYPWTAEAFQRARQEDKPIFLSIGYSACHWCHVMERESFSDPEVARLLNEHFICVKVDREERPDIDTFYMDVCQAMTGHGGWPLTIIMTPEKLPFFAGTYFPKTDRFGHPGLMTLLREIAQLWHSQREDLLAYAQRVVNFLRHHRQPTANITSEELLKHAYEQLYRQWDPQHGGFGNAPKFPMVPQLLFLLRWWYRTGDPQALRMVDHTLLSMRLGGIYDHIGFGFHRYATDERWRIPHFEKMLSDQALLMLAYAEAFQIQRNPLWAQTVREIFQYCQRELFSPEGTFYTSEDADSAGEEGAFYLWTDAELRQLLSPPEHDFLRFAFGVEPQGNIPGRIHNHLFQTAPWDVLGEHFGMDPLELQQHWTAIRTKLLAYRQRRVPPQRDEKVLTDWNGLMLVALSVAARSLGEESFLISAQRLATRFLDQWRNHGHLFHRYADGEWAIPGMLNDYAFLLWGLLELYTTAMEPALLEVALSIAHQLRSRFWDDSRGGFCLTAPEETELPLRYRDDTDGAIPAASAVACSCFLRLSRMTGDTLWQTWAEEAFTSLPETLRHAPMALTSWLVAYDMALGPVTEVCLLSPQPTPRFHELRTVVHRHFLPRTILLGAASEKATALFRCLAPAYANYPLESDAVAYVCTAGTCYPPVRTPTALIELLPIRSATEETPSSETS